MLRATPSPLCLIQRYGLSLGLSRLMICPRYRPKPQGAGGTGLVGGEEVLAGVGLRLRRPRGVHRGSRRGGGDSIEVNESAPEGAEGAQLVCGDPKGSKGSDGSDGAGGTSLGFGWADTVEGGLRGQRSSKRGVSSRMMEWEGGRTPEGFAPVVGGTGPRGRNKFLEYFILSLFLYLSFACWKFMLRRPSSSSSTSAPLPPPPSLGPRGAAEGEAVEWSEAAAGAGE